MSLCLAKLIAGLLYLATSTVHACMLNLEALYMGFITPRACARGKVIGCVVVVVVVVVVSTKIAISRDIGV